MDISFSIPEWLLWLGGGLIGIIILGLAAIGIAFLHAFAGKGFWR